MKYVKYAMNLILILFFGATFLFQENLEMIKSETEWSSYNYQQNVILSRQENIEISFTAKHVELNCFYLNVNQGINLKDGIINIVLTSENGLELFEYNMPVSMLESNMCIPNVCNLQLEKEKKYYVNLSGKNFTQDKVYFKADENEKIQIGCSYTYTDDTLVWNSRLIIFALFVLINIIGAFIKLIINIYLKAKNFTCKIYRKIYSEKKILIHIYNKRQYILLITGIAILFNILIIYKVVMSAIVLGILVIASWNMGRLAEKFVFRTHNYLIVTIAIGMGIIGCIVYYLFEFSLGYKWIILLLLMLPIFTGYFTLPKIDVKGKFRQILNELYTQKLFALIMYVLFVITIIYAAGPINDADAYVKHLPITMYANNTGQWYHNIIEDCMAYSESTLLAYCYAVLFAMFAEIKGFQLFNVFLFFCINASLCKFAKHIYKKTNTKLLSIIFVSTPLFFSIGTSYMVDCLPAFWIVAILIMIVTFSRNTIIHKLPQIAFFFGLCVFTKLTILSANLVLSIYILILCILWFVSCKEDNKLKLVIRKIVQSIICFVFPFLFSFLHNYFYTGNPFSITAYNNIFKSPYFQQFSFARPYADMSFGLSLLDLKQLVFKTDMYIEMSAGALGIFLLFVFCVPIAWCIIHEKKYFFWSFLPIGIYLVGGIIVGNLRYIWIAFAIQLAINIVALSSMVTLIKSTKICNTIYFLIGVAIIGFNISYHINNMNWGNALQPSDKETLCNNQNVLSQVPKSAKVISINDDQKGLFDGFFWSIRYANSYLQNKINDGTYDFKEYVKGFDYLLFEKGIAPSSVNMDYYRDFFEMRKNTNFMKVIAEDETHILYEIIDNDKEDIISIDYDSPYELNNESPIQLSFTGQYRAVKIEIEYEKEQDTYNYIHIPDTLDHSLSQFYEKEKYKQLKNYEGNLIECWVGISWNDDDNQMLEYKNAVTQVDLTQGKEVIANMSTMKNATKAYINIQNRSSKSIMIKTINVSAEVEDNILQQEINDFWNRKHLK